MQKRYAELVRAHLSARDLLASGLRVPPGLTQPFAATQAAWRFFENPRVGLRTLAEPLLAEGRRAVQEECDEWVLVVHDWSNLHYKSHPSKKDRVELSQSKDLGYEAQTALLVSDRHGGPLAPLALSLRASDGVHCSRVGLLRQPQSPLDELAPVMQFAQKQRLGQPAVHIIDSESDSVAHYRHWEQQGWRFLVRADAERVVTHEGGELAMPQMCERLKQRGAFRNARSVSYKGKTAQQWMAAVEVQLTRAARPQRKGEKRRSIPGAPITLRLVISEIRVASGRVLAVWYLLTNVPAMVSDECVALWYYWRWRIESYFKLMKSAGQHVEEWQQRSAHAIAKRVLVASMAVVFVWKLERSTEPEAAPMRSLLVRLSGRLMRRGKSFTTPAMLAGLWVLLAMLSVLNEYDLEDLLRLAHFVFPRDGP